MRNGITWVILLLGLLVSPPAVAQPSPPPQAQQGSQYRINPGDDLEIYVWGEERLQRAVRVLPDGTIAFPLAGQIMARGLLPQELEQAISERLQGQYRGEVPQITVSVAAPSGMQFTVMGRVNSPGTFTPGRYVNVIEALSMAGGPNEFANLDNILLIRKVGDKLEGFRLRVGSVFKGGSSLDDSRALASIVTIQPGDTLIIP